MLADCLKACRLTIADLELNSMSNVIKEALDMPGCRYKSMEDFAKNVENRLRFFQSVAAGNKRPSVA